eukprot:g5086.t1
MCRLLEAFSLSDRLKWLPRTLFLAKTKLLNFLIAYVCLVAGFSLLMTLYFGDIFQQFSTLDESFYTLLLYSFGVTDRAFLGCQPDIERGSCADATVGKACTGAPGVIASAISEASLGRAATDWWQEAVASAADLAWPTFHGRSKFEQQEAQDQL